MYTYKCDCSELYNGNTKQSRIYQHKYAIRNNNILHSGLTKRAIETDHNIREGIFEVLQQEKTPIRDSYLRVYI